jgi:acyl-CoA thioesterase-2
MSEPGPTRLERLLAKLDLRAQGSDRFVSEPGAGRSRLFGGLVAAQSLVAAARSVEAAVPHSLHAYFLRAGRSDAPIRFEVERTRDGRRFASRRVVALQEERAIFCLAASFTRVADGVAHQDPAPTAPPPGVRSETLTPRV